MSDVPARRSPFDEMMAAQDAAAARFEEQTGRKSTDPGPVGQAQLLYLGGRMLSITFGYDQPIDPDGVDHYARRGMARVHINRDGTIVRGAPFVPEHVREELRLRVAAGTPPLAALQAAISESFGGVQALTDAINEATEDRLRRAEAIEVDVWDAAETHHNAGNERWRREYMMEPPLPPRCPFVDEDGERCVREEHGYTGPNGVVPRASDGHRF